MASASGFSDDGSRYIIRDPKLVRSARHYLWNDLMTVTVDHRGMTNGTFPRPDRVGYALEERAFIVRDDKTGKYWTAPFDALQEKPESWECSMGATDITWRIVNDGLELTIRMFVPRKDNVELWSAELKNLSRRQRKVSLYSYFPVGCKSWFRSEGEYDKKLGCMLYQYLGYYAKVPDYYKRLEERFMVFCAPDKAPTSYECSMSKFKGDGGLTRPAALDRPKLENGNAVLDLAGGIFQYRRTLKPKGSLSANFVFGPAMKRSDITRLKRKYLGKGKIEKAFDEVCKFHRKYATTAVVDTPDEELNHVVNHWLPTQTLMLARISHGSPVGTTRNDVQNGAGGAFTDPTGMRRFCKLIFGNQSTNGYLPGGTPLIEGAVPAGIRAIHHRDGNVWPAPQIHYYLCETGDFAMLDEKHAWKDSRKKNSLYDHVCIGLDQQMADRSKRGLSFIGEGDWNDPMNMIGNRGKGESVWLTLALKWALDCWADIAEYRGDTKYAKKCRKESAACRAAVNRHGWDGNWYRRACTDDGDWIGSKTNKEGMIFANPQAWAMMTDTVTPARLEKCMKASSKHLSSPWGIMLLAPPYTYMHENVGKLTVKHVGMEENGAAYCHTNLFYAHGLYAQRQADEAYECCRIVIPGYKANQIKRAGEVPTYIPNAYMSHYAGRYAGVSSQVRNTGSAPWLHRLLITMMLGVRGEFDGLRIDPQLPSKWKRAGIRRKFRGVHFDIEIKRRREVKETIVMLDGKELKGTLIPMQRPGTKHKVDVFVP